MCYFVLYSLINLTIPGNSTDRLLVLCSWFQMFICTCTIPCTSHPSLSLPLLSSYFCSPYLSTQSLFLSSSISLISTVLFHTQQPTFCLVACFQSTHKLPSHIWIILTILFLVHLSTFLLHWRTCWLPGCKSVTCDLYFVPTRHCLVPANKTKEAESPNVSPHKHPVPRNECNLLSVTIRLLHGSQVAQPQLPSVLLIVNLTSTQISLESVCLSTNNSVVIVFFIVRSELSLPTTSWHVPTATYYLHHVPLSSQCPSKSFSSVVDCVSRFLSF